MTTDVTSAPTGAPAEESERLHHVTTIPAVAASAHMLRRRLLDVINVYGPVTTAQLADRTGHSAQFLASHLGILRDAHLIKQTGGPDDDPDARPWLLPAAANRTITNDLPDDPVSKAVMMGAHLVNSQRYLQVFSSWMAGRESLPDEWRVSAFGNDTWLWLSPAELIQLSEQVCELFDRWARRALPDDNTERRPVLAVAQAVRAEP